MCNAGITRDDLIMRMKPQDWSDVIDTNFEDLRDPGNVPEMVLICLALNKLGAIWVPICTDYKGDWLAVAAGLGGVKLVKVKLK